VIVQFEGARPRHGVVLLDNSAATDTWSRAKVLTPTNEDPTSNQDGTRDSYEQRLATVLPEVTVTTRGNAVENNVE
jgi:hypothetical protein